jgi:class 3 adenylate cyclase
MSQQVPRRRLAAILATDVLGYSRMMQADEAQTLAVLKARRAKILQPLVARYHGRIVKLMGDGALIEFVSAVEAVQCAVGGRSRRTMESAGFSGFGPRLSLQHRPAMDSFCAPCF